MDARLEIPVPGQHRRTDNPLPRERLLQARLQRAGIADAGRAAIANDPETQLLQIGQQARPGQVIGDDPRTGGQGGLDVRPDRESPFHGLFGQQAGGEHHARVGGVGAGREGGDQHVAVPQGHGAVQGRIGGGELQQGMAPREAFLRDAIPAFRNRFDQQGREPALEVRQVDAVLRTLGAGHGRGDAAEVDLDHPAVVEVAGPGHAEEPLGPVIGLADRHVSRAAARCPEVAEGLLVHREIPQGGPIFGRHVAQGRPVRHRQRGRALPEEFDEGPHHAPVAQALGHGQHEVGGGDPRCQPPVEVHPDDIRHQQIYGLAEHGRLRLDAAHAPAHHAKPVDHGCVGIGAHQGVRVEDAVLQPDATGQMLEIDLVADALPGGHHLEGFENLLAPFDEPVTFRVAPGFPFHIGLERPGGIEDIHLDGVVHHQVHRHLRLDRPRIGPQAVGRTAHGGKITKEGHAREILKQDAGHEEGDLLQAGRLGRPGGDPTDRLFGDPFVVEMPKDGFQHDAERHRQPRNGAKACLLKRGQGIEPSGLSAGNGEVPQGMEGIWFHDGPPLAGRGHGFRISRALRWVVRYAPNQFRRTATRFWKPTNWRRWTNSQASQAR